MGGESEGVKKNREKGRIGLCHGPARLASFFAIFRFFFRYALLASPGKTGSALGKI